MKRLLLILPLLVSMNLFSQTQGTIQGTVIDKNTEAPLPFVKVFVADTEYGTTTDFDGSYKLEIPTGTYTIRASFAGYDPMTKFNIELNSGNAQILNVEISSGTTDLETVEVIFNDDAVAITTDMVTPLSVQKLTSEEIKSNPGGNFDVSKVVQTLPGVGGSTGGAARNDIIIRGGAPNENVYYLDGIEIPVLNHFQTQGSSGGAQGILNVSFIEDLKLSSSAFDARYDNALASTFVIKQRQGNREKFSGNIRASFTESSLTFEGPIGKNKKTDYLVSARASYLDFLFTLIDLPIRPNFTDYQYKVTHRFDDKTTLTAIGLGAVDRFSFAETKNATPESEFFRRSLPFITQWNYTVGVAVKRRIENGYFNIAVSRNMFDNQLDQYEDAQYDNEAFRNLGLNSQEVENKFRFDYNKYVNGWKFSAGLMGQYVKYNTSIFNRLSSAVTDGEGNVVVPEVVVNFGSEIDFFKYGAFAQLSKNFLNDRLLVSAGVRSDMNSFTDNGNNPLETLSPRVSFAYHLTEKLDLTASVGSYYKIPTYTALGYRNEMSELVNQSMEYIQADHYVLGAQFLPNKGMRVTVEGFYKNYKNYPVSLLNGTSLANQGSQFGSIGSEELASVGLGQTYGFEIFVQQKLVKNLFYVVSYTYVRSLYSGLDGALVASAWDNQHLLSSTLGLKFGKGWKLGLKYRLAGGVPYTPYNLPASQESFATLGNGILDYTQLNSERLNTFNQLDFRMDKIVNYKNVSFDFYVDLQNVLFSKQQAPPVYTFKRLADNSGFETTDGLALKSDGSNAIPILLQDDSSLITPTIGVIFEF
ncbi:MAG: TonB-dependent receptor plug domain-containing protein [Crocinitomix sp.]|nr:TonB-dependent receptor plug domain-containing protein [Crocinitomix sp.]